MDKILKIINYLTPRADRAKHFYWGFVYMVVCTLIGRYSPIKYNVYIVLILCGLIGFIKELYDHKKRRAFDWVDFMFTILPCLVHLIFKII